MAPKKASKPIISKEKITTRSWKVFEKIGNFDGKLYVESVEVGS